MFTNNCIIIFFHHFIKLACVIAHIVPAYDYLKNEKESLWHVNVLPGDNDDEVHDVPHVSQVAAGMEDEPLSQNFQTRFHSENTKEIGLCDFLKNNCKQNGLVVKLKDSKKMI